MAIYFHFKENKESVLFTTNVAARGLDFPKIQWVIQFDMAEDVQTYVHRVGRTARFVSSGKALCFLDPSEEFFVDTLKENNIQLKKVGLFCYSY
jgi:ATP-dependent RNA helicase DDX10/DBP4